MNSVDDLVCFSLYAASRATTQAYRALLQPWKLTYTQYLVLVALWRRGDQTVGELAELLSLDSGTLSPLLRRLEGAGYVERTRSSADERVVTISLTQPGRALRRELSHIPEAVGHGTQPKGDVTSQQLIETLADLTRAMREVTADATAATPPNDEQR